MPKRKKKRIGAARRNPGNAIRAPLSDRVTLIVICAFLFVLALVFLYPILYVLSASFSSPRAVEAGQLVLLPVEPSLDGYAYVYQYKDVWTGYANTLIYTIGGTTLNLIATLPAAYALSRRDMRGRNGVMVYFMVTMYFSGGMIPSYLNMRDFGLLNSRAAILIVGLVSVYNMIIARTYFSHSIPWEIQEAARVDGCNDFQTFFQVIVPLSKAIIVVLVLYYAVGHWNSYFTEMIYLQDRSKFPLSLFLREILMYGEYAETAISSGEAYSPEEMLALMKQADTANMLKYCFIVISTAPMLILYPFLQRFFEKGVMIGSVKM
ncbi:MAG TPA: carbohydrate ABC transporter permease [Candidatus Alectryocaccomicrobium excrementavium]|uniref:Carbohydrate ABC transporter permease n=1 Tax=Candidatus Alectryocaccomicrobium excrementavium TaxID=2840668 RepID=A0A9D1K5B0_9FIRM|nr:carbohydrate ABC transporter permease [Candidatus Alectryocaccomicrobium excrementavium]